MELKDNRHERIGQEYDFLRRQILRGDYSDCLSLLTHLYLDVPDDDFAILLVYKLQMPDLADLTIASLPDEGGKPSFAHT